MRPTRTKGIGGLGAGPEDPRRCRGSDAGMRLMTHRISRLGGFREGHMSTRKARTRRIEHCSTYALRLFALEHVRD
jgi:hypothetical protein